MKFKKLIGKDMILINKIEKLFKVFIVLNICFFANLSYANTNDNNEKFNNFDKFNQKINDNISEKEEINEKIHNIHKNYENIIINNSNEYANAISLDSNNHIVYNKNIENINFNKGSVSNSNSIIHNKELDNSENNLKEHLDQKDNKKNKDYESNELFNSNNYLLVFISSSINSNVLDNYASYLKNKYSKLNIPVVFVLKGCVESAYSSTCNGFKETAEFSKRFLINSDLNYEKVKLIIDPKLYKEFNITLVPTFLFYNEKSNLSYLSAGDGSFKYHTDLLEKLSDETIFNN